MVNGLKRKRAPLANRMILAIPFGMMHLHLILHNQIFRMPRSKYMFYTIDIWDFHSYWCQFILFLLFQIYVVSSRGESNAIGSCGIGPQEPGMGKQHWQDMIHNARQPTALWHHLR